MCEVKVTTTYVLWALWKILNQINLLKFHLELNFNNFQERKNENGDYDLAIRMVDVSKN